MSRQSHLPPISLEEQIKQYEQLKTSFAILLRKLEPKDTARNHAFPSWRAFIYWNKIHGERADTITGFKLKLPRLSSSTYKTLHETIKKIFNSSKSSTTPNFDFYVTSEGDTDTNGIQHERKPVIGFCLPEGQALPHKSTLLDFCKTIIVTIDTLLQPLHLEIAEQHQAQARTEPQLLLQPWAAYLAACSQSSQSPDQFPHMQFAMQFAHAILSAQRTGFFAPQLQTSTAMFVPDTTQQPAPYVPGQWAAPPWPHFFYVPAEHTTHAADSAAACAAAPPYYPT